MKNPVTVVLDWLIARPLASHVVIAALETYVLATLGRLGGLPHPAICAAVVVSTFYYGREAGQHEHDLKHATPPKSPFLAFAGASFGFLWGLDNLVQWLVAAAASSAVAAALILAKV